jgi:hypothetical protein
MQTFEVDLDPVTWTEILLGGSLVSFDIIYKQKYAQTVEAYFSESGTAPAEDAMGTEVISEVMDWDFSLVGASMETQRVWTRGDATIRGVRDS